MNGRIYDPTLGRFLQADPHIQAPENSQSYNRYSYVLNNPLSYTDPSGYFFDKLFKGLNKLLGDLAPFVAIAIAFWNPGALLFNSGWAAGAATGFIAGGVATGSLKGALIGAFTAGVTQGFGLGELGGFEGFLANGVVGGLSSVLSGGKFGHGFLSAGISSSLKLGRGGSIGKKIGRVVMKALIGGTVSKITGGKFGNGATTAAFAAALRADWSETSERRVAKNLFNQKDKAAFDADLDKLNFKVTRQQGFADADEAAQWLHDNAHPLSVKYNAEVGAKIYEEPDGDFAVGKVVTNYHSERVSLGPSSWQGSVDSIWHSHGTSYVLNGLMYSFRDFSSTDIKSTKFYNYGYMSTRDLWPTQDYLYRIPGGGNNSNKCLVGSTC